MVVLSPDGQILQINRAITRTLGFSHDELRRRPSPALSVGGRGVERRQSGVGAGRQSLNPLLMETWVLTKAGERRRMQWSLAASPTERKIWSKSF